MRVHHQFHVRLTAQGSEENSVKRRKIVRRADVTGGRPFAESDVEASVTVDAFEDAD